MRVMSLVLILACSGLQKMSPPLDSGATDTGGDTVDASSADLLIQVSSPTDPLCEETEIPAFLHNIGAVTLSDVSPGIVDGGEGWRLASDLPRACSTLDVGERCELTLASTGGEAWLKVETSAGDWFEELTSSAATTTTLGLSAETEDGTLARDGDVVLTATVTAGDLASLQGRSVRFTAGGTELGSASLDATGQAQLTWSAADRQGSLGDLTLGATLEDACGVEATAALAVCVQGVELVEAMDLSLVKAYGSAEVEEASGILRLVEDTPDSAGSAFFSETVGAGFHLRFQVWLGDRDLAGGGGTVFLANDIAGASDLFWLGEHGCALGYTDVTRCKTLEDANQGFALELDTRQYGDLDGGAWASDETLPGEEDQLALVRDGRMDDPLADVMVPNLEDGAWHTVEVRVDDVRGELEVRLDDERQLLLDDLDEAFYQDHWIGFSASTADEGEATNAQMVRDVEKIALVCP